MIEFRDPGLFGLHTGRSSYWWAVTDSGAVVGLYHGAPLAGEAVRPPAPAGHSGFDPDLNLERAEVAPWGGVFHGAPTLKVAFDDGVRDLRLAYTGHDIAGETLTVSLVDATYDFRVDLVYIVEPAYDLIRRFVRLSNRGTVPVTLDTAASAAWPIPVLPAYRLTHVTGAWAREFQVARDPLPYGVTRLASRSGFTSPHANPWYAIDDGTATEDRGDVWFGALAWSGNWTIGVERTVFGNVRVTGGVNDEDFAWRLEPGETFVTPEFVGGHSAEGFGGMSRRLHAYVRTRGSGGIRPVLYNSWYATYGDVNAHNQLALARRAAGLGAELFVIDAGWFEGRADSGLGDWAPDPGKFPDGLAPLAGQVAALGMGFGLWVEPEMVSPASRLYAAHPDWVVGYREPVLAAGRYVLNLARDEVAAYLFDTLAALVRDNGLRFLKWDFNRTIFGPGWLGAPAGRAREFWVRYVRGLYGILDRLHAEFPGLAIETCAGGGGRIDLGILGHTDQAWVSDNTDPSDRLAIQDGYSYAYPARHQVGWVTDSPDPVTGRTWPLKFRFLASMTGVLGIGGNLTAWTDDELAEAARWVATYKRIRGVVQQGDQYRLRSGEGGCWAVQYVGVDPPLGTDEPYSVVYVFRCGGAFDERRVLLPLRGLGDDATYVVTIDDVDLGTWSGRALRVGLPVPLTGDPACALVLLTRQN